MVVVLGAISVSTLMDPDGFMHVLAVQACLHNWIAEKHVLQTSHTEIAGWILYSIPNMNAETWSLALNGWIAKQCSKVPITIGLEHHAIFDGKGKEAQKNISKDEWWAKHALHVICKWGNHTMATTYIPAFLLL